VLAAGWFLLMPSEYQSLGKHVRDTVLFSSNLRYLKEAGYFAVASDQKWLLHSWSLSVEWQFYLIYPVIILFVSRLTPGLTAIRIAVAVLFVVSFSWCLWLSLTDTVAVPGKWLPVASCGYGRCTGRTDRCALLRRYWA